MGTPHTKRLTQAERTAISDKRIMDAAIKLVSKQGYAKTTLAQIGKQAGYTAGHVSHRFGSKDGLLQRMAEMIVQSTGSRHIAPAVEGHHGLDAVCAAATAYIEGLDVRPERTRALFVLMFESLGPVPVLRPLFREYTDKMRESFARNVRDGITREDIPKDIDPENAAIVITALLRGVAMQWLMEPNSIHIESVCKDVVRSIRSTLGKA